MKITKKRLMDIIQEELGSVKESYGDMFDPYNPDHHSEPGSHADDVQVALGALNRLMSAMPEKAKEIEAIIVSIRSLAGMSP